MARLPIRPLIVVEAIPRQVDRGQSISVSARLFDKRTMRPIEVSRIYMSIISEKDGKIVWPLEVIRKNADGFDILIGTDDMQDDTIYLIRVSNNWNMSPSAATTMMIRKKTTLIPLIPLIPLALHSFIQPVDSGREVEKYIFRTQMDHRVCKFCKQWEDNEFKPDDKNIPHIPIHPRCRCTMDVIYVNPDQVTNEMRQAARAAMLINDIKIPLQAIQVIQAKFY